MKEPEIIVANQTYGYGNIPYGAACKPLNPVSESLTMLTCPMSHVANPAQGYGNVPCESPEDNAPAGSRRGRTGAPAIDRAIALSECCSTVRLARMNTVCGMSGRSSSSYGSEDSTALAGSYRMYSAGSFPGVGAMARLKGLRGKAGSIRPSPRANKWKDTQRNARCQRSVRKDGDSDEAIVPVTSVITSGEREGSLGSVAAQSGRGRSYSFRSAGRYEGNHMPNKQCVDKRYSNRCHTRAC